MRDGKQPVEEVEEVEERQDAQKQQNEWLRQDWRPEPPS
jgi:hypothetical protein